MLLRPTTRDEADAVAAVHRAAFGSEIEADLARDLMLDAGFEPAYSFAAEEDDALVGSVVFSRAAFVPDGGGPAVPVLLLAPLAVVPEAQHDGVGTALVEAALALADALGEAAAFVFGDPAYYGRFGFVAAMPKGYRGPHPLEPEWGWQVLEFAEGALGGRAGYLRVAPPLDAPEMWIA
jgi:predicted N-acetyltransferase YhbS